VKIAVVHDYFETIGGGETEMKMLAEGLAKTHDVHFYTSYFNKSLPFKLDVPLTEIGSIFRKEPFRQSEISFRFSRLNLDDYDVVITENYWSAFVNHRNHIHHCEAPIRQFYDMRGRFTLSLPYWKKIPFNIWCDSMIHFEQKAIKRIKTIVANSEFTKTRIKMYYDRDDAVVIYPPVITERYRYKKTGNYFLYVGRLDTNKRIEFMIEAFKRAKRPLIVIGSGPLIEKAKKLARGASNIKLLGYVPEEVVIKHYANCMATVYFSMFEDFGQVPVEGMSAGKPCLGAREGGMLETIIDGKTGWLMLPRMDEVVEKIKEITPGECRSMRRACEKRAQIFDIKPYLKKFNRVIEETVK
jgi:glycosyltransferase involved in cell wall biosynthesis